MRDPRSSELGHDNTGPHSLAAEVNGSHIGLLVQQPGCVAVLFYWEEPAQFRIQCRKDGGILVTQSTFNLQ